MPISSSATPATELMQRLMDEQQTAMRQRVEAVEATALQSTIRNITQPVTWVTTNNSVFGSGLAGGQEGFYSNYVIGNSGSVQRADDGITQLQRCRQKEKDMLQRFIYTGTGWQVYGYPNGEIVMYGYNIGGDNNMFIMDSEKITAQAKRTKHLKPLLTKLAKREGRKLVLTTEQVVDSSFRAGGREIMYYAFNGMKIDDTELVMTAQPILRERPSEGYDDEDEEMPF